jgi:hypothetical protein
MYLSCISFVGLFEAKGESTLAKKRQSGASRQGRDRQATENRTLDENPGSLPGFFLLRAFFTERSERKKKPEIIPSFRCGCERIESEGSKEIPRHRSLINSDSGLIRNSNLRFLWPRKLIAH